MNVTGDTPSPRDIAIIILIRFYSSEWQKHSGHSALASFLLRELKAQCPDPSLASFRERLQILPLIGSIAHIHLTSELKVDFMVVYISDHHTEIQDS